MRTPRCEIVAAFTLLLAKNNAAAEAKMVLAYMIFRLRSTRARQGEMFDLVSQVLRKGEGEEGEEGEKEEEEEEKEEGEEGEKEEEGEGQDCDERDKDEEEGEKDEEEEEG
ncbi:hypothetical protein DM02DRAFT_655467 [Periconia macrospinosa]|uniref:Uncharacterized protein n=1 Tax=Periconia macrospinosa TaxID=97972 RepID=A0A2V1DQC6_9PLEO|nr:hypothetical protein DM02DRAFT_655467 [Periconia macrospinosa]